MTNNLSELSDSLNDVHEIRSSLDELFSLAKQYRSSKSFHEFIKFVGKFYFYSPFNAMLVHIQKPGTRFAASASRWRHQYGRNIKPNAHPLVILQPQGPVMFVFDVSDTESGSNSRPLPSEVDNPFGARRGKVGDELECTIENAKRDGVEVSPRNEGSQSAGSICSHNNTNPKQLKFLVKKDKLKGDQYISVPLRYELVYNSGLIAEGKYATIVHELAHLYCGHLGTPNEKWWKGRLGLSKEIREFEAESVAYIICARLGIDNPSDQYLSGYVKEYEQIPDISLETILKVSGLIERMGRVLMKPRKESIK